MDTLKEENILVKQTKLKQKNKKGFRRRIESNLLHWRNRLKKMKAVKRIQVLEKQIKIGLTGINNLENISIAYEPVWAIGTGKNCGVEETKQTIDFIREFVKV